VSNNPDNRLLPLCIVVVGTILILPAQSFALDMEYYTWGGHSAVVSAFSKLALIFSDNGYKALFASVIVLALVIGGGSTFVRAAFGVRVSPIAWVVPILVGVVIYLGLVVPTGTLHIYDKTKNAYTPVAGVPNGIVAMAGILSTIENGLVEIVNTAGDPLGYQVQAGGVGFLGLFKSSQIPLGPKDSYFDASMNQYIKDCVSFELQRPGTTLTVDELRKNSTDLRTALAKAVNPSIYTIYSNAASPNGVTMSCTDAMTQISAYLNTPANLEANIKSTCAELGFNPTVATQYQACQTSMASTLSMLGVTTGTTSTDFIRQAYIGKRLNDYYRSGDGTSVGNYQFLINASGTMKSANEWLPTLRAVLTAIAVGLIPFLALFMRTRCHRAWICRRLCESDVRINTADWGSDSRRNGNGCLLLHAERNDQDSRHVWDAPNVRPYARHDYYWNAHQIWWPCTGLSLRECDRTDPGCGNFSGAAN